MKGIALPLFAILVSITGCEEIGEIRGEVGGPAPAFSALTLDGDSAHLSDLAGQVVLLNVWATWCAPCREEIPALQALYEQHAEQDFLVVGVSVDGRREVDNIRRFAADFGMTYPIWHDPDDAFGPTFRTIGVPVTLLIDRDGIVRWRHMGPVEMSDTVLTTALTAALAGE
jgi:cytochrome c biogenesis protein CcmG/thiol:disulfide interchange protein DsbE